MMGLAGAGRGAREGARMGVWGAAQAGAVAIGGFLGAAGVQTLRAMLGQTGPAFVMVFAAEAALFLVSAVLAARLENPPARSEPVPGAAASSLEPSIEFEGAH
jgi:BCD family chlorophyll transporter-like MFS transporter